MGTPASRDDYTKSKTFRSTMFTSKGFEYFGKVFEKIDLINMPDLKRKKESPCTPVIKSKASPGSYTATPPSSRPNYERETISSASKKVVPKGGSSEKRPKKRVARQRKKTPLVQLETNNSTLSNSLEGPVINQYLDDEGEKISMFECMENTLNDDMVTIIMPKYNERSIPDSYNQEQKDVALLNLDAFDWKRMELPFRFSSNVFTELEQAYKEVHIDTDVREVMNAAQNNQKNCEYDMSAGLSYLDFVFKTGRNTKTYLTEMDLNVMKIGWIPMILHDFGFQYTLDKLVIVYEATCMRTHPDISCKEAAVVGEHKKLDILKHRNDILKVVLLSLQFAKLSAKDGKGFALGYLIDQDKAYLILVSHQSTDDQLNINSQLQVFKTFDMTQREEVYQLFSVLYTFVRYKKLTKV